MEITWHTVGTVRDVEVGYQAGIAWLKVWDGAGNTLFDQSVSTTPYDTAARVRWFAASQNPPMCYLDWISVEDFNEDPGGGDPDPGEGPYRRAIEIAGSSAGAVTDHPVPEPVDTRGKLERGHGDRLRSDRGRATGLLVAGETITAANATAKWGVTPTPNFLLDTLSISGTKVTVGLANYHQVGTFVVEISAETSLGNTYSDKITVHNE